MVLSPVRAPSHSNNSLRTHPGGLLLYSSTFKSADFHSELTAGPVTCERASEGGEGEFRRQSPRRTRGKALFCERTKRDVVRLTFHGALNGSPSRKVLTLDRAPLTFFAILLPARGVGVGVLERASERAQGV